MTRKSHIRADHYAILGDAIKIDFTIYDSNGPNPGLRNLTGYSVTFQLEDAPPGDTPANTLTKTVGDGVTLTDPGNGVLRVTIAKADLQGVFPAGTHHYALKRTDAGSEHTLAFGEFLLVESVLS